MDIRRIAVIFFCVFYALNGSGQNLRVIKLADLSELISTRNENVKVINFWATWCGPCVKELPQFEKANAEKNNVNIYLVSMDLDLNPDVEKVKSFVARKNIKSTVLLLDEKDPNEWISQIDSSWSGALPATLVINGVTGKRKFVEKELHPGDLDKLIFEVK